jgi:Rrf2 family protein
VGPLNLSVKGEYALLAILDLSMQRPGEPVKIAAIAQRQRIPQKFLELILAGLKQGGFVESRRGADGGYLLARPADQIRVGDVLRYMEGGRQKPQRRRPENPFTSLWNEIEAAVTGILEGRTMADVARTWSEKQSRYVPNWEI